MFWNVNEIGVHDLRVVDTRDVCELDSMCCTGACESQWLKHPEYTLGATLVDFMHIGFADLEQFTSALEEFAKVQGYATLLKLVALLRA